MTTFAAQNFGARNNERVRRGYHASLVTTVMVMVIGSMALLLITFVYRSFASSSTIPPCWATLLR